MLERKLPVGIKNHCMVTLNSSTVMLIGGTTQHSLYNKKTFFYDIDNQTWTDGPDLISPRCRHKCGMIKKDIDSDEVNTMAIF